MDPAKTIAFSGSVTLLCFLDDQVMDITAAEVKVLLVKAEPIVLVDVRTDEEQSVCRLYCSGLNVTALSWRLDCRQLM